MFALRFSQTMVKRFLVCGTLAVLLSSCSLIKHPQGGLKVISTSIADVYLDGKNAGTTPLSKNPMDVKKYALRLVPQDASLASYDAQVKIFAGFETTVDWSFGTTKDDSSGFIFEAEAAHKRGAAELEIITSPDNVPITINNENKGFSPLVLDSLPEGDYQLGLQAPGFLPITRDIRLLKGKRLLITAKLARKPLEIAASPSASLATPLPTPSPIVKATPKPTPKPTTSASSSAVLGSTTAKKPYIQVVETPTGFLRVRSTASSGGTILGQLNVGDTAAYAGQTVDNWFKIVFPATSSAWVSGQYAKLIQ